MASRQHYNSSLHVMPRSKTASPQHAVGWIVLLLLLIALRLPSLVQPAGGDQGLYEYEGQRVLAGGVLYRDAWDQKPPGVGWLYAGLWRIWPHESIVPAADLGAAFCVAALLIVLGRRTFGGSVGYVAAAILLFFGNPAFQRLDGLIVHPEPGDPECETFIAVFITLGLVLLAAPRRKPRRLVGAGVALGIAILLKYNAALYLLPFALGTRLWRDDGAGSRRWWPDVARIVAGCAVVIGAAVAYFAAHGALHDLKLATIDYNLEYSRGSYQSITGAPMLLAGMFWRQVKIDWLWFLGAIGAALTALRGSWQVVGVPLIWLVAAILSVAANGGRGLPQYFVQAAPALAFVAAVGLAGVGAPNRAVRLALVVILLVGVWRVGDEPTTLLMPRALGLHGLLANLRFDLSYARGHMDRESYLGRFQQPDDKYLPLADEQLATRIKNTTSPTDSIYVFGFSSASVYVKSERRSASRFFWSRPVVIEFAKDQPGYGSAGLLQELKRDPPAVVALQKRDWGILAAEKPDAGPPEMDSIVFFMSTPSLRQWLEAGYHLEQDTAEFAVWRRQS